MIDYRELLKKYINHVGDCEGTTFITTTNEPVLDWKGGLTTKEWEELKLLEIEASEMA